MSCFGAPLDSRVTTAGAANRIPTSPVGPIAAVTFEDARAADGAPIARERIRGTKEFTYTEDDGTFQGEITGKEPLYIESKRRRCELDLSIASRPEYYLEAGDVICRVKPAP